MLDDTEIGEAFTRWLDDHYTHTYVFSKGDMRTAFGAGTRAETNKTLDEIRARTNRLQADAYARELKAELGDAE